MTSVTHSPSTPPIRPLREYELRILGHLLGRREGVERIAHATGLSLEQAREACASLCEQGRLNSYDDPRGTLYSVRI